MSFGFGIGDFIGVIELANKIRKEFVNAPNQFMAISDEVRSLSIVLQDADFVLTERELNKDQKRDLDDIRKGCQNVLVELQQILDKYSELSSEFGGVGKRMRRVWKRLKWEPEDIKELRSRINTNIDILNAFNGRLTQDHVVKLVRHQEDQGRQNMLNWLTSIDYAPQQNDFITRRQEGTGQWLLDSAEFQMWLETDRETLFCPGIPGSGKTILSSIVVDHLHTLFQNDPDIGIAYLYCNFRRQHEQKADDLVASLLKQLVQEQSPVPESVEILYNRHKDRRTRPSLKELKDTLHSVITAYSRVYLIIDALDECQLADSCRSNFLSSVFNLQAKTKAKLFTTSRPIPDIEKIFKGCISLEILASNEDIRRYLNGHISQLPTFVLSRPNLQEEIKTEIIKAVEGMFLLAQLYLSSLEDKTTAKAIKRALTQFQKQNQGSSKDEKLKVLSLAYEQAMERINGQREGFRLLANDVLSWIICANRPLTTGELQHAIAVEINESELDDENIHEIEDMISVCAGLVTIDKKSDIIRLVHYTTQEYFERSQKRWFPDIELQITTICITYLSFSVFEHGFCQTHDEFKERMKSNQFFEYAARNWGHHARKVATINHELREIAKGFLTSEAKVNASSQALFTIEDWSKDTQTALTSITGLHLTAYFGIKAIVKLLLDTGSVDADSRDMNGQTPLWWAARNGHEAVVKLLLDTGSVDADLRDINDQTPLSKAAENGHEVVVKLLLNTNLVDGNSKDTSGRTPLSWAAKNGHEAVVKLLLNTSLVDVNAKDISGRTPLWWVAGNGHEAVVKLLLNTNSVDADLKDIYNQTPLSRAAGNGHKIVVKLLLETGSVDANSKDIISGQTPLSWAARNGHEGVVKLLLDTGLVNVDLKDIYDQTPLSWAARNEHKAVVNLLLNSGLVDINSKDIYGRTPLSWAAKNEHKAVVKLLLNTSLVDADLKDTSGQTPLSRAAENGHEAIVKLLLNTGLVDTNSKDISDQTPLSKAARNGHEAIVKLLLDIGLVKADLKDINGQTPLSRAAENGHEVVVKLLLNTSSVDVDSKDTLSGQTPLSWAAENGHKAVVELLLGTNSVNANLKDMLYGQTPLSWAAENGHEAVVKLLLDTNLVDVNLKDTSGRTPLSWATKNGHESIVKLLLDTNLIDVDLKDTSGRAPLSWAAENGHEAVVKLLLDTNLVDVNLKDTSGRTPLSWAIGNGHEAIEHVLLEEGAIIM